MKKYSVLEIPGCDVMYEQHVYRDGHYVCSLVSRRKETLGEIRAIVEAHDALIAERDELFSVCKSLLRGGESGIVERARKIIALVERTE